MLFQEGYDYTFSLEMAKNIEIEIFKAGKQVASNGEEYTFSVDDLRQTVETFNPEYFRPPTIISHDTRGVKDADLAHSELCYGVPKYLKVVGDTLIAGYSKISQKVRDWVDDGLLHSVSSSFYLHDSLANPYPGKLSLRHIALLGKTPPAVKGLRRLEFSLTNLEEGVVEFSMLTTAWGTCADFFQKLREHLIEEESIEVADKVLPADAINNLRSMNDSYSNLYGTISNLEAEICDLRRRGNGEMSYAESDYEAKLKASGKTISEVAEESGISEEEVSSFVDGDETPSDAQKKKLDKCFSGGKEMDYSELERREEILLEKEAAFEKREVADFVEGLVKFGKILAAKRDDTITLILNTSDTSTANFSESAGGEKTPRQALKDMLSDQPSWNYGEEIAAPIATLPKAPNFSVPEGFAVDSRSDSVYKKALAYAQIHNLDPNKPAEFTEAIEAVRKES